MNPDDPLLQILACPLDKGPLHLVVHEEERPGGSAADADAASGAPESLYNPRLHRRYPIVDGIPQLLPSSGEQVTEDEHEALLRKLNS
ncbi:Trm112 family protein [Streptomyces sp. 11x1]|uniref:Trm112 family protein n=1 Tax=Streptomyces sp. 11x1 TaxID=3038642 RepID=UPI00292E7A75|nr:Trm112 family protein [Streptomyces sp. 11x1]WNZ11782.1 Trm112 family protein [Streptomyces sp. 11x1]